MQRYLVLDDERNYPELIDILHAERVVIRDVALSRGSLFHRTMVRALRQITNSIRLFSLVFSGSEGVLIICQSSHYAALIAGKIGRLFRRDVSIYLFNFFVNPATRRSLVRPIVRSLLRQRVGIYVNAPNEVVYYRSLNPSIDVHYYPFCLGKVEGVDPSSVPQVNTVFSGGHTNRDYESLFQAAGRMPDIKFLVACSAATVLPLRIPQNVSLVLDTPPAEFHRLMASARAVVVPLASDIGSSGQMVALAAMQFGKVVVYADYPSLSQYFEDGVTGIRYTPLDVDSLTQAISTAYETGGPTSAMGSRARAAAEEKYSWDAYERELINHVNSFSRDVSSRGRSTPSENG